MRELRLIEWPFDSGRADFGMGLGSRLLATDDALRAGLADAGWRVSGAAVEPVDERRPEIARIVELDRRLAAAVREAVEAGASPVVLAGNCVSSLGTVAGLRRDGERLGVVWLDAHADLDTPDDNLSGFFDVMALSIVTGSAWRALRESVPGFVPVDERDVVLAAVRDLEPYQRARLARSAIRTVPGEVDPAALGAALDALRTRAARVYLHVDLDALDADEGRANEYAAPGGPTLERLLATIDAVFARFDVAAAALTAYDPDADADGRALAAARAVAARIASASA